MAGLPAVISTGRAYQALGFAFRFESDDDLLAEVVRRCYSDMPAASTSPHVLRASLRDDGLSYRVMLTSPDGTTEFCGEGTTRSTVLELLCWEINRRATRSVRAWPVVHAGVIGGPLGAIVVCGQSQSGKSTLTAAAARRGWHHLSDDLGPVDVQSMTVTPFPRPMMLRPGGREHLGQPMVPPDSHVQFFSDEWFVPASELGATVMAAPQSLVAVVVLEWRDQAVLEPLSRAQTLHGLAVNSATLKGQGASGFADLERIVMSVPGYRLGLGTADDALDLLSPLVGWPQREPVASGGIPS